jgi:hypothetical protein
VGTGVSLSLDRRDGYFGLLLRQVAGLDVGTHPADLVFDPTSAC